MENKSVNDKRNGKTKYICELYKKTSRRDP